MARNAIKDEPKWDEVEQTPGTNCEINDDIDHNVLIPHGASYENFCNVEMEMDNKEEDELETYENMVGEADIGDLLCVKLETEEDWKKQEEEEKEEYNAEYLESTPAIFIKSESLFCKEESKLEEMAGEAGGEDPSRGKLEAEEGWMKDEEEYDANNEYKEHSENEELNTISVRGVPEEADFEDYARFCMQQTANVDPLKLFDCTVCQKSLRNRSQLLRHMLVHTGEKPFSCRECHKSFSQKGSLMKHLRGHTGERPFTCTECSKSFGQRGTLLEHMRVHTGEKPFSCTECRKSFRTKPHLLEHRRVHTGEKPFNCTMCQKSFSQSSTLISHIRVHTGEKPYKCSVCQKSFKHKGSLTKHTRLHAQEEHLNIKTEHSVPQIHDSGSNCS